MNDLLSISIPTYNRAKYLKELLYSIYVQIKSNNDIEKFIKIYVYDNCSPDNTYAIVNHSKLSIKYKKNTQNIGADLNIFQAYTKPDGQYIWVIGDDELLPRGSLAFLLNLITHYKPHLIINYDGKYKTFGQLPFLSKSYKDLIKFAEIYNPHLLIAHSLITANIIRKDCFDAQFALEKLNFVYGHFYGIVNGLKRNDGLILCPNRRTIIIRTFRGEWGQKLATEELTKQHGEKVSRAQIDYLEWLRNEYAISRLVPSNVVPDYLKRLEASQNPIVRRFKKILKRVCPSSVVLWRYYQFLKEKRLV